MLTAAVVVAVRELLRTVSKLTAQLRATTERLVPLSEELQSELAVTSVEIEGLTEQVNRLQTERTQRKAVRPNRRKPRRKR
jgi:hypothetical protein